MINMFPTMDILHDKIIPMVAELNQIDVTDTQEDTREKAEVRARKAEYSRKLLELADTFALLEALTRNEYWFMKGRGMSIEIELMEEYNG